MKPTAFTYKIVVVVFLLLGVVLLNLASNDIKTRYPYDKLAMLARFSAKEYCTCRFVLERSTEDCTKYIDAYLPIFGKKFHTNWITSISEKEKSVFARTLLFVDAKADYLGQKGCLLESKIEAPIAK